MSNTRSADSNYSSFGTISDPGTVTGSIPTHESTAGAIGSAFTGLSKILEVGVKLRDQTREDKLNSAVEDQLNEQVKDFQNQPKPTEGGPSLLGESESEADMVMAPDHVRALDKLRQGNAQGTVSRAEFYAKTSAIVQQAIHDNPRYADAIRKRAQEVLGVNPTAQAVSLEVDQQKQREQQQQEFQKDAIQAAVSAGTAEVDKNGQLLVHQTVINGLTSKAVEAHMKAMKDQRDAQHLEWEETHGTPMSTAQSELNDNKFFTKGDGKGNPGADAEYANMTRGFFSTLPAAMKNAHVMNDQQAKVVLYDAINNAQKVWDIKLQKMIADSGLSTENREKMRKEYNSQFQLWQSEAGQGWEYFRMRHELVQGLADNANIQAWKVAPDFMRDKAILGDIVMGQISAMALSRDEGTKNRVMINGHVMSALDSLHTVATIAEGKPYPDGSKPSAADHKDPEVRKVITPIQQHTMDKIVENKGTPSEDPVKNPVAWANTAEDVTAAAAKTQNPINAINYTQTRSPSQIAYLQDFAKDPKNVDQAQRIGKNMIVANAAAVVTLAQGLQQQLDNTGVTRIGSNAPTDILNRESTKGQTPVTFKAVFNGATSRYEIVASGNAPLVTAGGPSVLTREGKSSIGQGGQPVGTARVPDEAFKSVNAMNQALDANVALKNFGSPDEQRYNDQQLRQQYAMAAGLPLKEGTQLVPMPVIKKPETPLVLAPTPEKQSDNQVPGRFGALTDQFSEELGLDKSVGHAIIMSESDGKADAKTSETGNVGIAQLGEAAAKDMGVDRNSPSQNLYGGLKYFKTQLDNYGGDVEKAAIAYKAGPEKVEAYLANPNKFPMVQAGVRRFLKLLGLEPSVRAQISVAD